MILKNKDLEKFNSFPRPRRPLQLTLHLPCSLPASPRRPTPLTRGGLNQTTFDPLQLVIGLKLGPEGIHHGDVLWNVKCALEKIAAQVDLMVVFTTESRRVGSGRAMKGSRVGNETVLCRN